MKKRKIYVAVYSFDDERFENYTIEIEGKINRESVETAFYKYIEDIYNVWKLYRIIAWSIEE